MKKFTVLIFTLFLFMGNLYSQTDAGPDSRTNVPGNWNITPSELNDKVVSDGNSIIPKDLMDKYLDAKNSRNEDEKIRLGKEIDKYLNAFPTINNGSIQVSKPETAPMAEPYWGIGDYPVYIGDVAYSGGFRQMDMKFAEDGNLYIAINRRNVSGSNGYIAVYRSTNGGKNWIFTSGAVSTTGYIGQISMLVEKRHATLDDSTRIILYFTLSTASNMDNATLNYATFLRNGSVWYSGQIAAPTAGNRFQYPTACSDGMYYGTATYMHCVVQEMTNAGVHYRTHHYRSTDWCLNHTAGIINTTWADFYPSAGFSRELTTTSDSIYVAVERRFSTTNIALRMLVLPEIPSTVNSTYYLAGSGSAKYEKPSLTIQQEYSTTPRKILVTCTKDTASVRSARYCYSTNSGSSWQIDYYLGGSTTMADFTVCNSDSTTAGTGNFIGAFVNVAGDSITVRRGVLGSMGTYLYKRNAHTGTGVLAPVVAVYKEGGVKYSAFAYAGFGPTNVYANQENLAAVGIDPISGNVPKTFKLEQNYPNPFNPTTTISFDIAKAGLTKIRVYNTLGVEVATLVNESLNEGSYRVKFDASGLSSGVYFYKIETGEFSDVRKMTLVK